ncbi:MAG: threonine synthase [Treponema sp.]|nr:threonine synthase [Treponema sp.]
MRFTSTRDKKLDSGFLQAVTDCMPADGGLYVPEGNVDLRRWILYTDNTTTFTSIAGTLTSACINTEFSPIICETIATKAFSFEPQLKRLGDNLFTLELFNGPTGCHRDYGISFLTSCLETILTLSGKTATFLDLTSGPHGASLSRQLRGKSRLKSVLIYPKGNVRGLNPDDFVWNGGNVYPVEIDGDLAHCRRLIQEIFADHELVKKLSLTVSTTANIGRLLPQAFFYTYAFSRLKDKVSGDIYYAMAPGNYSNLVAGLYSWRTCLPLRGFIVPTSGALGADVKGYPIITDSMVNVKDRPPANASDPSNLERLEDFFTDYSAMIKSFIYPAKVDEAAAEKAAQDLYKNYDLICDQETAQAYAAAKLKKDLDDGSGDAVVLIQRDHPAYTADFVQRSIGEKISVPKNVQEVLAPFDLKRPLAKTKEDLVKILEQIQ